MMFRLADSRAYLRKQAIKLARVIILAAFSIPSPKIFLGLVRSQMERPRLRDYMIRQGVDEMIETLMSLTAQADMPFAHRQDCYGQEGEDLFLRRFFAGQEKGVYVDVGALHPFRFSNTYFLYEKGWSGINIDATPGSMKIFDRKRPRDVNVECVISNDPTPRTYFQFAEPALNTMSEEVAHRRRAEGFQVMSRTVVHPRALSAVLDAHLPLGAEIDMMTIDVEGLDLAVLTSNDWARYKPRLIIVELLETALRDIENCEVYRFLLSRDYNLISKLYNSAIFVLADVLENDGAHISAN